ncbi:nucleotidyltransferase family protein [Thiohalomonas denitrificans]|uniref:Molybdenum cofactor cytidylyltransferase n=1 Tax=Thiohalomonas denitrificans TaxID=415747 RepID=A0A1G5PTZ1_9GAMM|nr:nucleotidyltransferase family protein [Thiohalomonas denitrificans]SCZ53044.1 molybdenum cofactor cytidylyltransferase [Thiohalomonas denitrificans]
MTEELKPIGLLLAAGAGTRFGGRKLLAPLSDGTPLGIAAARHLRAAVADCIVVVGPAERTLTPLFRAEGLRVVECPDAAQGMGHSLACGVAASRFASGWIVALADMPWIAPDTIRTVAATLSAGAPLAAPIHHGRRGHPVGIAAEFRQELQQMSGDAGARHLLRRESARLVTIPCDDPGVLRDVDSPADLPSLSRPS